MNALDDLRKRWSHNRFQRAMQQYQAVMVKHSDLMETENGMLSMLMVSGIAQLVAHGLESPAALADTIKQESIRSGIPEDALAVHARFSSEMVKCFEFDKQISKSPR